MLLRVGLPVPLFLIGGSSAPVLRVELRVGSALGSGELVVGSGAALVKSSLLSVLPPPPPPPPAPPAPPAGLRRRVVVGLTTVGLMTADIGWKLSRVARSSRLVTLCRPIFGMDIMTVVLPLEFRTVILVLVMLNLPICRWTTLIARRNRLLATLSEFLVRPGIRTIRALFRRLSFSCGMRDALGYNVYILRLTITISSDNSGCYGPGCVIVVTHFLLLTISVIVVCVHPIMILLSTRNLTARLLTYMIALQTFVAATILVFMRIVTRVVRVLCRCSCSGWTTANYKLNSSINGNVNIMSLIV